MKTLMENKPKQVSVEQNESLFLKKLFIIEQNGSSSNSVANRKLDCKRSCIENNFTARCCILSTNSVGEDVMGPFPPVDSLA